MGSIETNEVDVSLKYAVSLDAEDPLKDLREEFIIPSKADLKSTTIPEHSNCHRFRTCIGANKK